MKRALGQRQIPTLLGLGILIASLIGGIALISSGGGVFAPRATAQTAPKNLKLTNIKDTSFTVSFITDENTSSFIKYGKSATDMKSQAADDRDQLNGNVGQFHSHYVTLRDLDPDLEYFFIIGTPGTPRFDNNGTPFSIKTAKKNGNPTTAKTSYGSVNVAGGAAADGAVVYMSIPGVSNLSALVKSSGSWAIPLSNARTQDLTSYANIQLTDQVSIFVQGTNLSDTTTAQLTIADTQPAQTLVLGTSSGNTQAATLNVDSVASPLSTTQPSSLTQVAQVTESPIPSLLPSSDPVTSPVVSPLPAVSPSPTITTQVAQTVDLKIPEKQTVDTDKPTIMGKAAPNTLLTVEIHSTTPITTQVKTDENGDFTLPLANGATSLEPGEHTVTVSYTDPKTGQQKSVVRTFTVAAPVGIGGNDTLLALANPSPTPYGTENPYTISSPSPTPSLTPSPATSSASPRVSMPSTSSDLPKSGSTDTTIALIVGGCFLIGVGIWSYKNHSLQTLIDFEEDELT